MANIRGDHSAAEERYRHSLAAYEALSDQHGSAIARHNLGRLAADRRDHVLAIGHYEACQALAEASGDAHLGALCLVNHAEALLALGQVAAARDTVQAAGRIFATLGSHFDTPDVQRVLALCDRADGLMAQAEARLVHAGELARITDARLTEAEVARDLGRLYAETGRLPQAHASLQEAMRGFAGLGAMADVEATERELAALGGPPP